MRRIRVGKARASGEEPRTRQAVFARAQRLASALFAHVGGSGAIIVHEDDRVWRAVDPPARALPNAPVVRELWDAAELVWIEDCRSDPRMADHPFVTGMGIRLYIGAPIRLEDGSISGHLCVASGRTFAYDADLADRLQDLADLVSDEWRRLAAQKAREAVERERDVAHRTLAAIIAAMPASLALTDRDLRILDASQGWFDATGFSREVAIGRSLFELRPEIRSRWEEQLNRCLAGEDFALDRVRAVGPNGAVRWMQCQTSPWRDSRGDVGGLILASHDVTEIVEALERTARSEARLKVATELTKVHVWELDWASQRFAGGGGRLTAIDPALGDQMDSNVWGSVDRRDAKAVVAAWDAFVENGAPFNPEFRRITRKGSMKWCAAAARQLHDDAGRPLSLVCAIQDVTAHKEQEAALIQAKEEAEAANQAKTAFLATMSHEIRTPLNGVLGMAQAMALGSLDPDQRERLGVVRQSGEALLALLNDILDLSKIEAGKLTLEDGEFDVSELVQNAHATFEALADNRGLNFRLEVKPAALGRYRGDPVRVRQVIYNLISNALKFTEEGEVGVIVNRRGGELQITVSDTGIGMTPEQQHRLFNAFEQADASTTRRYGGTGLGLSICGQLVDLMDGRIVVRSRPGAGTTFRVSLPLRKLRAAGRPAEATAQAPAEPSAAPRSLRVLAAEDNSVNQLVLKTLLAHAGVEPVLVFDGRAAVDAWAREPWDVILMDVQMPVLDGPSAVAEIRARERAEGRPRTPILALTANAMEHQVQAYLAGGMDGFIGKPIEAGRLFAAIEAALVSGGEAAEDDRRPAAQAPNA
jgi:PAS domain S-box-containing protein